MLQFLFDTDHLTLYEHGHPPLAHRLTTYAQGDVGIGIVTVEEALRGRLAVLARVRDGKTRIYGYQQLAITVKAFHLFPFVDFDQASEDQFQRLWALRVRIGTRDLKIAAIALAHRLTLLTRNHRDFSKVPGIVLDDWS